jgi:acetyl esterase/lipase
MKPAFEQLRDFVFLPQRVLQRLNGGPVVATLFPWLLLATRTLIAEPAVQTLVYKRVGSLEIKPDVYQPAVGQSPRPVIVYIHGGSLINLGRNGINPWSTSRPTTPPHS